MKMKKISAANIQEALNLARRELGDDAVLLETRKAPQGKGVIVTFAIDGPDESLFDDDDIYAGNNADILPFTADIPRPASARVELEHPALALIAESFEYHSVPGIVGILQHDGEGGVAGGSVAAGDLREG